MGASLTEEDEAALDKLEKPTYGEGVGAAAVSEKHAGFVVNCGGATTDDIRRTMELVQTRVLETSGVQLEPEVRIW